MSNLKSIKSALETKLNLLVGEDQPLVKVYGYYADTIDWFPSLCFEPDTIDWEYLDTIMNQRKYQFQSYIVQEFENISREEALDILENVFTKVVDLLDSDYTLGGECIKVGAMGGTFSQEETTFGKVLILNIPIICYSLYNTATWT